MTANARAAAQQFAAAVRHLQRGRLIEAERLCREACASDPHQARYLHVLGVIAHKLGRPNAAELIARAVALDPRAAQAHNDLGVVLASDGRLALAAVHFERAALLDPQYAEAHSNLGNVLQQQGKIEKAALHLTRAAELAPSARTHVQLGALSALTGKPEQALHHYRRAVEIDPAEGIAHFHLANALKGAGRPEQALVHYRRAVALAPDLAEAHNNLGTLLHELGALEEAAACCRRAVELRPTFAGAHNNLGNALRELGDAPAAAVHYQQATALDPGLAVAHYNLGLAQRQAGELNAARASFERALELAPERLEAKLALSMGQLPPLYEREADIAAARSAYTRHLNELAHALAVAPAGPGLADAVGWHQPFYLAYQGGDDRALQELYGKLVCRIIAGRSAPATPTTLPAATEPVRVGIVSGFFCQHSNWKVPISGWLGQLDRSRFRLFGYHTGVQRDAATKAAAALCERFVEGPLPVAHWRDSIARDAPHVLIYPEIGMDPLAVRLAAQRLAPVQCTSWGHPVTSGLPTLDYYLSSDLMEPDDAQAHYTERLIRLPNLSIYYEPHTPAAAPLTRSELGLRESATVFWCGQSLPKYLPQFDHVFPRIARVAGDCQFVFLAFAGAPQVSQLFAMRLERAFAAFGLHATEHTLLLPRLDPQRFHAAMGLSDIFLDSIGWSGCNSTLESLAHDLPIVTLAGRYMRGRHSAAIVRMMGMEQLIATDLDGYVAAAGRLAADPGLRAAIAGKIAKRKERVFRDRSCIAALQEFLDHAARHLPLA